MRKWITVALAATIAIVLSFQSRKTGTSNGKLKTGEGSKQDVSTQAEKPKRYAVGVAVLSAVAALLSAVFSYSQVEVARHQAELSRQTLNHAQEAEDLRFVGGISIRTNPDGSMVSIENKSQLLLNTALLWTVGANYKNGEVQYFLADVTGLGACSSLHFTKEEFRQVGEESYGVVWSPTTGGYSRVPCDVQIPVGKLVYRIFEW